MDDLIPFSELYWEQMQTLVHSREELEAAGYRMEGLTGEEIEGLKRCRDCGCRLRKSKKKPKRAAEVEEDLIILDEDDKKDDKEKETEKEKKPRCRFHPGTVVAKHFTCCNAFHPHNPPGCVEHDGHTPRAYGPNELEDDWTFHPTPPGNGNHDARLAIALDCEMGTSWAGDAELIRISAVDYFSGRVLVDSLVYPAVAMAHFNTRYSGVTRGMLETARRANACLEGRDEARLAVWQFVGPHTVLVMHGGKADLLALRWIHGQVIDTYVVEAGREMGSRKRSLRCLAEGMLGRRIQEGEHDSVEDARACRGVVHWYVENGL